MFGASDFPLPMDYHPMPDPPAEEPAKRQRTVKETTKVTPAMLEGMDTEELLEHVARNHEMYLGQTLKALMQKLGISGIGGNAEDKMGKINVVLTKLLIQYEAGQRMATAVPFDVSSFIEAELPAWIVAHSKAFEGISSERISDPTALLLAELNSLRIEFFARFEPVAVYYGKQTLPLTCDPTLVTDLRTYVLKRIVKGDKRPIITEKPKPKPAAPKAAAPAPSQRSNAYLLNTVINYSKDHLSNGLRLLTILMVARTPEVQAEITLFTNGWASGIGNAVRASPVPSPVLGSRASLLLLRRARGSTRASLARARRSTRSTSRARATRTPSRR